MSSLAGRQSSGYADGAGTNAQFNGPFGIAVDSNQNVYVADAFNHAIRKITSGGKSTTYIFLINFH